MCKCESNPILINDVFDENGMLEIKNLAEYIKFLELSNENKNIDPSDVSPHEPLEALKAFERLNKADYIFRGETESFPKRVTSAFRLNCRELKKENATCEKCEKRNCCRPYMDSTISLYPDFTVAIDEYYREISHRLSDAEKDNFIAFSQHHGLPTNFLDVTYQPLAALFMACYKHSYSFKGSADVTSEPAFVYIFEDYIDVTDIMSKYPDKTVIELLIENNDFTIKKMWQLLDSYQRKYTMSNKITAYTKQLCQNIHEQFPMNTPNVIVTDECKEVSENAKIAMEACDSDEPNVRGEALAELRNSISKVKGFDDVPTEPYFAALIFYLRCTNKPSNGEFMPYMIYRPKEVFKRARLQQGFFIVQPFKKIGDGEYNKNRRIRLIQEIKHSKVIKVSEPERILRQLDYIGINLGTMYGDNDNIAKHIVKKHEIVRE